MTATAQQIEIPAGFAVVDVTASVQHYHDGDSWYRGEVVQMFNPVTQAETVTHFGTDANRAELVAMIDTAARDQWEAYTAEREEWVKWFRTVADVDNEIFEGVNGYRCERGDTVEVFRGRKCPRGVWEVTHVGHGQYGQFAHLRNERGDLVRFVSPENFRILPECLKAKRKAEVMKRCPEGHGETVWAFLFADSPTGEFSAEKLPFLCDYIEDGRLGEVPSAAGKWIRERFCK